MSRLEIDCKGQLAVAIDLELYGSRRLTIASLHNSPSDILSDIGLARRGNGRHCAKTDEDRGKPKALSRTRLPAECREFWWLASVPRRIPLSPPVFTHLSGFLRKTGVFSSNRMVERNRSDIADDIADFGRKPTAFSVDGDIDVTEECHLTPGGVSTSPQPLR